RWHDPGPAGAQDIHRRRGLGKIRRSDLSARSTAPLRQNEMPGASAGHDVCYRMWRRRLAGTAHRSVAMVMPTPMVPVARRLTHVVALVEAEHAFDATNHGADRAGDAIALIEAMRGAAGNALRLRGERHGEHCEKRAANQQVHFHEVTSV